MPNWCDNKVIIKNCDFEALKKDATLNEEGRLVLESTALTDEGRFFLLKFDADGLDDFEAGLVGWCDTAYNEPEAFIYEFMANYDITGSWQFSEMGGDFAGEYIFKDGQEVELIEYDYNDERNQLIWIKSEK